MYASLRRTLLPEAHLPGLLRRLPGPLGSIGLLGLLGLFARTSALAQSETGPPPHIPSPSEKARSATGKDKSLKDYGADCLRPGCHAELNKLPFVHSPVAVGACAPF